MDIDLFPIWVRAVLADEEPILQDMYRRIGHYQDQTPTPPPTKPPIAQQLWYYLTAIQRRDHTVLMFQLAIQRIPLPFLRDISMLLSLFQAMGISRVAAGYRPDLPHQAKFFPITPLEYMLGSVPNHSVRRLLTAYHDDVDHSLPAITLLRNDLYLD